MSEINQRDYRANKKSVSRIAYVKLRVIPKVRMPKSVLLDKIKKSCQTGVLDSEIDVRYVEYDHQTNGARIGWQTPSKDSKIEALKNFYKLVKNADNVDFDGEDEE